MALNAMFYQVSGVSSQAIEIGPLKMSVRQVIIGIQTALIVAPVSIFITSLFRYRKTKAVPGMEDKELSSSGKNVKQRFLLPYSVVFVAWFFCVGIAMTSATVTVFYSLHWEKSISDQWMASVLISLV